MSSYTDHMVSVWNTRGPQGFLIEDHQVFLQCTTRPSYRRLQSLLIEDQKVLQKLKGMLIDFFRRLQGLLLEEPNVFKQRTPMFSYRRPRDRFFNGSPKVFLQQILKSSYIRLQGLLQETSRCFYRRGKDLLHKSTRSKYRIPQILHIDGYAQANNR